MLKSIYLKEEVGNALESAVSYATLTQLLREEGVIDAYNSAIYYFRKGEPFTVKNIVIRKIPLKHQSNER